MIDCIGTLIDPENRTVSAADGCNQCDPGPPCRFGIVAPVRRKGVEELLRVVTDRTDKRVPDIVRACLGSQFRCWQLLWLRVADPGTFRSGRNFSACSG
jgi:hypothetical protein